MKKKQQQKNMLFRKLKADLEERAHRSVTKCSHSKSFPTSSKRYIRLSFTAAVWPQQSTLLCLTNWSKEIHCFVMKVLDILPLIHCFQNTSNPPHHVLHKGGQFHIIKIPTKPFLTKKLEAESMRGITHEYYGGGLNEFKTRAICCLLGY